MPVGRKFNAQNITTSHQKTYSAFRQLPVVVPLLSLTIALAAISNFDSITLPAGSTNLCVQTREFVGWTEGASYRAPKRKNYLTTTQQAKPGSTVVLVLPQISSTNDTSEYHQPHVPHTTLTINSSLPSIHLIPRVRN